MLTLIIGGSGSGKSAYAESYIEAVSKGKQKYYLATMQVSDSETEEKVKKHQRLRMGKGFITIEQPYSIEKASEKMQSKEQTALLECMSNLTANEMFSGGIPKAAEVVAEGIIKGVTELERNLAQLVIVTNNVFEDGRMYDNATMEYLRALGIINQRLADRAEKVVEVVTGIPLVIKESGEGWKK